MLLSVSTIGTIVLLSGISFLWLFLLTIHPKEALLVLPLLVVLLLAVWTTDGRLRSIVVALTELETPVRCFTEPHGEQQRLLAIENSSPTRFQKKVEQAFAQLGGN